MSDYPVVRGYKIVGDPPKPDKQISTEYLRLKPEAAHARAALLKSQRENGANCTDKHEFFSGDTLPSDREAVLACAGCKSWTACDIFKKLGHPSWGVWAGEVRGRGLMESLEDEEDERD